MKYQTLIDAYDLTDKTSQDLSGESSCYPQLLRRIVREDGEEIFKPADKKERQAEYYHHMFDQLEEQYGKDLIIPGNYFKSYRSYANDYKYSIITRIDKDIGYIYFYPKYLSTQGHLVRMLKRSDTVAPVEQSESFDSLIMKDYSPMIRKAKSYFGFLTADEMQELVDKQPNLRESEDIFKPVSPEDKEIRSNEYVTKRLQQNLEAKKIFDDKYGPLKVGDKIKMSVKPIPSSARTLSFVSVVKELKEDPIEGPVIFFDNYKFLRTYSYMLNTIAWPNLEVIHK